MIKTVEEATQELAWRRWWRDQTKDMHVRAVAAAKEMEQIRRTLMARGERANTLSK